MEQELTVEVTEFDNLRNEYMQYEAAGEDYVGMLEARLQSEYRSYVEEDPVAAEDYLAAGKALIRELTDWAQSERHRADTEFVAHTLQQLDEEVERRHFTPQPDDRAWVYLAGPHHVCLHYGNDTDNVRLVYTREGVEECIEEAVRLLRTKRDAREAELRRTIRLMQEALKQSQNNRQKLDRKRLLRTFHCPMIAYKVSFLEGIIEETSKREEKSTSPQDNKATRPQDNKRTSTQDNKATRPQDNKKTSPQGNKKTGFEPELNRCYRQFVEDLAQVTAPLVMAGDGKTVLFRFALSIPRKGEIEVSWDAFNCRNYLYAHTFAVQQDYRDELRTWWATSCMLEMKRLKVG